MTEPVARFIITIIEAYFACGVLFAIPFVLRGAGKVEPVAQGGTWGFRVLIFPGSMTLWPYLLYRWVRTGR